MGGDLIPPPGIDLVQLTQPQPASAPIAYSGEAQPFDGEIRGQVLNGTEGGVLPQGMEVVLHAFDGNLRAFSQTATIGEEGRFRFERVQFSPGRIFVITAEHMGVVYTSEPAPSPEDGVLDLTLTVFDTTTDLSLVQVERLHVILSALAEDRLQVMELWIISNLGDRTVAMDGGEGLLEIRLPAGAANIQFESDAPENRFEMTGEGFIDRLPIHVGSGSHEIFVGFEVPFGEQLEFLQPIDLPASALVLLTPGGGLRLKGEGIADTGVRQAMGTNLLTYSAAPLSAGEMLRFVIMRGGASQEVGQTFSSLPKVLLGVAALLLALLVGGNWLRSARAPSANPPLDPSLEGLSTQVESSDTEAMLQAIADLDQAFEAGEMGEQAYRERRPALMGDVLQIIQGRDDRS